MKNVSLQSDGIHMTTKVPCYNRRHSIELLLTFGGELELLHTPCSALGVFQEMLRQSCLDSYREMRYAFPARCLVTALFFDVSAGCPEEVIQLIRTVEPEQLQSFTNARWLVLAQTGSLDDVKAAAVANPVDTWGIWPQLYLLRRAIRGEAELTQVLNAEDLFRKVAPHLPLQSLYAFNAWLADNPSLHLLWLKVLAGHHDPKVRRAAYALADAWKAEPSALLPGLADCVAAVQQAAFSKLERFGDASLLPEVMSLLQDERITVRKYACALMGKIGDAAVVPDLVPLLKDPHTDVRRAAFAGVTRLGDASSVLHLLPLLKDPNPYLRWTAVEAVVQLGDAAVVPHLVPLLTDAHRDVRRAAIEAVGRLGGAAVVPHLVPLLKDPNPDVRRTAVEAVGRFGDAAVVPHVVPLLRDVADRARAAACEVLGKIGDAAVVPHLVPLLTDPEWKVRSAALEAVGRLGDAAVVPDLVPLFKDSNWYVRRAAVEAITRLGDAAVVPHLVPLLRDDADHVRSAAREALGKIAADAAVEKPGYRLYPG